jgi:hypothetical protein
LLEAGERGQHLHATSRTGSIRDFGDTALYLAGQQGRIRWGCT